MAPPPALTTLPLAGTAARGRNWWFAARTAVVYRTERLMSAWYDGYTPPRDASGIPLADPGLSVAIYSKRTAKAAPIIFELTRADAVALASAILTHAEAAPSADAASAATDSSVDTR